MEINNNQIQKLAREYVREAEAPNARVKNKRGSTHPVRDKVELSQNREDVDRAKEKIRNLPDKREAEVKKVKAEIREGTYNPPVKQVAERIVNHYIIDTLV